MITHPFEFISKLLFSPFYFFPVSFTFLSYFFCINLYLSHCFVAWLNGVDSLWGCARGLLEYSCTVFKGPSSWVVYLHYRHWILGLRSDSYMKWGKGWPFYLRSFTGSCSCLDFVVVVVVVELSSTLFWPLPCLISRDIWFPLRPPFHLWWIPSSCSSYFRTLSSLFMSGFQIYSIPGHWWQLPLCFSLMLMPPHLYHFNTRSSPLEHRWLVRFWAHAFYSLQHARFSAPFSLFFYHLLWQL